MRQDPHHLPDDQKRSSVDNDNNSRNYSLVNFIFNVFVNGNLFLSIKKSFLSRSAQADSQQGDALNQLPATDGMVPRKSPKQSHTRMFWRVALAILLGLSVPDATLEVLLPETKFTVITGTGDIQFRLPDGTKVSLAKGSTLRYIQTGFDERREVFLKGEGAFDVSENPQVPFVIRCEQTGAVLKLNGGPIEVNQDQAATGIMNILMSGKGGFALYAQSGVPLGQFLPGNSISYNPYTQNVDIRKLPREKKAVDGKLVSFDGLTVLEIAEKLEATFDVKITVAEAVKNCRIQATFEKDGLTITRVLDVISLVLPGVKCHPVADSDGKIRRVKITGRNCDASPQFIPREAIE
jgi:ferric-dicitrate binding protein FerR (iron transport regulator)